MRPLFRSSILFGVVLSVAAVAGWRMSREQPEVAAPDAANAPAPQAVPAPVTALAVPPFAVPADAVPSDPEQRIHDLLTRVGAASAGPLAGMPHLRRWQGVALADGLAATVAALQPGERIRFAPFADRAWVCRVDAVRTVAGRLVVNAVPEDEPRSALTLELHADEVVLRLDRLGRDERYAVGRQRADGALVAGEIDQAGELAALRAQATEQAQAAQAHAAHVAPVDRISRDADGKPLTGSVGGPDATFADLPPCRLKDDLVALAPAAQARALALLRSKKWPAVDLTELRVDGTGALYYACAIPALAQEPAPVAAAAPEIAFTASVTVPAYHSRASQTTRVCFLDFDGETLPANMAWGASYAGAVCRPFHTDSDDSTYSDDEQNQLMVVWQSVAQDYAPFEIDVTTVKPATMTPYTAHVLITDTTATPSGGGSVDLPHSGSGGVAYVNVYGQSYFDADAATSYNIAWVTMYTGGLLLYTGQAASHEFGHNLSLSHDGQNGSAYYGGHSSSAGFWAPIMGGGQVAAISQFSKGEYYLPTNTEDDLAAIATRLTYRADDCGATIATATAIAGSGTAFSASGTIETTDDTDAFTIDCGAGALSLTVTPDLNSVPGGWSSPNLDVKLKLYDSSGTLLASSDPSTMDASISTTLASAGSYTLKVQPAGSGNPTSSTPSGYTTYGSLGTYAISGTRVEPNHAPVLDVPAAQTVTMGEWVALVGTYSDADAGQTLTATWSKVSGPGAVTIGAPGDPVVYERDGTYVMRLSVDDGTVTVTDLVKVIVSLPGTTIVDNETVSDPRVSFSLTGTHWHTGVKGFAGTGTKITTQGAASATWSAQLEEKWYDVSYWKVVSGWEVPDLATVVHADGTTQMQINSTTASAGWVSLGTFRGDGSSPLTVTFSTFMDNNLQADAVRFIELPGEIIDGGHPDYHESGPWAASSTAGMSGSGTRFSKDLAAQASWNGSGLPTEARVLLYRVPLYNNDLSWTAVVASVDGPSTYEIDSKSGVAGWADLGRHTFSGTGTVTLGHETAKVLRADAVRYASDTLADYGDLGYREEGTGWLQSSIRGHDNSTVRYSTDPAAVAVWRASLAPGKYRAWWYRIVNSNSPTDLKVEVLHDGVKSTVTENLKSGASGWKDLGTFDFTDGVGQVRALRKTLDNVPLRVDAVRFEPLGDSAPVTVVSGGSG